MTDKTYKIIPGTIKMQLRYLKIPKLTKMRRKRYNKVGITPTTTPGTKIVNEIERNNNFRLDLIKFSHLFFRWYRKGV